MPATPIELSTKPPTIVEPVVALPITAIATSAALPIITEPSIALPIRVPSGTLLPRHRIIPMGM